MITFEIEEDVKTANAGVYMITFSTGEFYIGSSMGVSWRIKNHVASIKSGAAHGVKSLKRMANFSGVVRIKMLEHYPAPSGKWFDRRPMFAREYAYIEAHIGNPMLLNDPRMINKSVSAGLHIKKSLHEKIKRLAKEAGKGYSEFVEDILTDLLKDK